MELNNAKAWKERCEKDFENRLFLLRVTIWDFIGFLKQRGVELSAERWMELSDEYLEQKRKSGYALDEALAKGFEGADYAKTEASIVRGKDVHAETMERYGCTRLEAKRLNFGRLYGTALDCFRPDAKEPMTKCKYCSTLTHGKVCHRCRKEGRR